MQLNDKCCLITGGTMGIGAAAAIALAEKGANVALVARKMEGEARETCRKIENLRRKCVLITADMAVPADISRCVKETVDQLGPVDVLIHSAGGPVPGSILEIRPVDWHNAFNVHVHAIFYLCQAVIPMMQKKKEGAIVLVGSAAGKRGCPGNTCYQIVKGTLPQFARALAREYAADNIRVNNVAPGVIRTRFHQNMTEQMKKNNLDNRIPLKREGNSEQVASVIRELVTNDYITGETFSIDGGLTMRIA